MPVPFQSAPSESRSEPGNPAGRFRILFLGDIVGEPGRKAVLFALRRLRQEFAIDFVIVNGENAAGGRGITPRISIGLLRAGAAVITTGDHVWDQSEIIDYIATEPRLLRPLNYPAGAPGHGSIVLDSAKSKVAVVNVQGRTYMNNALENPFLAMDEEIARLREETPVIFVDMHAETTSEKIAMGRFLDGRVSAVVGTHTHVQTADEQVFPGGTAFLSDAGMCGPVESILGRAVAPIVHRFRTGLPQRFPVARGDVRLCGAWIEVDPSTGKATRIERVSRLVTCENGDWKMEGCPLRSEGAGANAGEGGGEGGGACTEEGEEGGEEE